MDQGKSRGDATSDELLDLLRLCEGLPCITAALGRRLAEACAVCMEENRHEKGKTISVAGIVSSKRPMHWPTIDDQVRRSLNDLQEATEDAACGVAILLIVDHTEFTVVKRSRKRTGFDYWLGKKDDFLFQHAACLEVSGILSGTERQIEYRVNQKIEQTARFDSGLPTFVAVVEFGRPHAAVVKR